MESSIKSHQKSAEFIKRKDGIDKFIKNKESEISIDKFIRPHKTLIGIDKFIRNKESETSIDKFIRPHKTSTGVDKFIKSSKVKESNIDRFLAQSRTANLNKYIRPGKERLERLLIRRDEIQTPQNVPIIETKDPEEKIEDVVLDAIVDLTLKPEKKKQLVDIVSRLKSKTKNTDTKTLVSYLAGFMKSNAKVITYTMAATIGIVIASNLIIPMLAGTSISWFTVLTLLQRIGVNQAPKWMMNSLGTYGVTYGKNFGISGILSAANRNTRVRNLLKKEVKPKILVKTLNVMGIDISNKKFTVEDIARETVSRGIDIGRYGSVDYLLYVLSFEVAQKLVGNPVELCKKGLNAYSRAKDSIVDKLFSSKKYKDVSEIVDEVVDEIQKDLQDVGTSGSTSSYTEKEMTFSKEEIEEAEGNEEIEVEGKGKEKEIEVEGKGKEKEIEVEGKGKEKEIEVEGKGKEKVIDEEIEVEDKSIEEEVIPKKIKIPKIPTKPIRIHKSTKKSQTAIAEDMITTNKILAFSTVTGVALTSLAFASSSVGVGELVQQLTSSMKSVEVPPELLKGFNWVNESEIARRTMYSFIADKIGISKFIEVFADKITPNQMKELLKLDETIGKTQSQRIKDRYIFKFFEIMLGTIYDKNKLQGMSIQKLKEIAKERGIKGDLSNFDKNRLISAISSAQISMLNSYLSIFTNSISSTLKTAVSTAVVGGIVNVTSNSIQDFLASDVPSAETVERVNETLNELEKDLSETQETVEEPKVDEPKIEEPIETERERRTRLRQEAKEYIKKVREERGPTVEKVEDPSVKESMERRKTAHQRAEQARLKRETVQNIRFQEMLKKSGLMVQTEDGTFMPAPSDEFLLDPKLRNVLKDIKFTRLSEKLAVEAAKSAFSAIPGVGLFQGVINNINLGVDIAEGVKDLYKISNVLLEITEGESSIDIGQENIQMLDAALKYRLPSITESIENLVKTEPVSALHAVQRVMREVVGRGLSKEETAAEIAREFFGRVDYSETAAAEVGKSILNSLSGLLGQK